MLKKLSAVAGALVVAVGMSIAPAAIAGPGNCDCTYMATGYNQSTGEFIYEWVCPDPVICQITVEP
ncbi:hypothetical protein GCM10017620_24500 [Brevundimonas intermedia]|uniref:Secreted protein n=1 Tax=Brevundimonas intermedia TaxID=74315 RepID=A0ABQ5T9J6_9CAUL|nr:hypothetical protein [Brevundimonas intermedia]GLK49477.1 hypothetical protein GCM10017620_24500 [Brevundimonas intermedia]